MAKIKHGMSNINGDDCKRPPIYRCWLNMRSRCSNPNRTDYYRYGERGIKVCERWNDFAKFYEDMGEPPTGYTLDRIDNEKDYCPENCRWSSRMEQVLNRNCTSRATYRGQTKTLHEWLKEIDINISHKELYRRIYTRGWEVERAFTQPVYKRGER